MRGAPSASVATAPLASKALTLSSMLRVMYLMASMPPSAIKGATHSTTKVICHDAEKAMASPATRPIWFCRLSANEGPVAERSR